MKSISAPDLGLALCLVMMPSRHPAWAGDSNPQPRHTIAAISICTPGSGAAATDCPAGTVDSEQVVLGPDGHSVNGYGGMTTLADEHSTIFPPGTLPGHHDYLFWVASRTALNSDASGTIVLSGGSGPDQRGQWTLDFATDFGLYFPQNPPGQQNGQLLLAAMAHEQCPFAQDQTFDLNYADPGTVFVDPTKRNDGEHGTDHPGAGRLLMLYEGTTRCIGEPAGKNEGGNFYSTLGVATSLDFGHSWPTYRANWVPLPLQNPSVGPNAPFGTTGSGVCIGNDCSTTPAADYGRYAVLSPQATVAQLTSGGGTLPDNIGDSEPAAFVDDVHTSNEGDGDGPYLYVVDTYQPGPGVLPFDMTSDLVVARARLNGGSAPLQFTKWHAGSFSQPGLGSAGGGVSTAIFTADPKNGFANCLGIHQKRAMGSISYVEATQQYLLTFVCQSPSYPATQTGNAGDAWFYATLDARSYDLSHQEQWSTPQEIIGSWSEYPTGEACPNPGAYYPSFMSLDRRPGHLGTRGYAFYLKGCADNIPGRQYASRTFAITIK